MGDGIALMAAFLYATYLLIISRLGEESSINIIFYTTLFTGMFGLVFALFELNPAPFCMLDEVDAPLDDINATRFVAMVEEMSDRVQFIFITHNKISMEKSDYLMGVTMQEAGVSRVVSVDVKEALKLAAS